MQPKLNRDAISGFLLALIGAAAAYRAFDYGIGSAARMGSGYFPLLIGGALVLLGAVIAIGGLRASATPVHIPRRELFLIAFSVASFALIIGRFGLFPALGVSVLLACLADRGAGLRQAIGIVLFSCLLVWLVFVIGLNSPTALIKV